MRLSHSRIDVFNKCKRWFYYQYIKKISVPSDDRHARRGNVFHKCAQYIVNSNPSIEEIKTFFANKWHEYKLEDFNEHKDETYTMVINFYNCKPLLTSTELEVLLPTPEFVGYIDGVNTNEDIVIDYKTSGWYNGISETEYKNQMGRYAYLYFRKFGRLPKKVIVYWVKFFPFKTVEYIFTEEDIFKYEQEIFAVDKFVEENKDNINVFTCCKDEGKECNIFCPYENECSNKMTFVLHLTGSYIRIEGEISDLLDRGLEKKFSYELKNAHWIKKNYPQANTTVRLWKRNKQLLPSGFLSGLKKTLSDYADYAHKNLELIIIDERVFDDTNIQMPASFVNGNTLREYQQQASNVFLDSKVGLLELGTGAGKTEIAIEIIRKLKIKTLFIVDKKELLRQTKERMEQYLGIEIGQIGDNEQDIKSITVATIQTLIKRRHELAEYLSTIRFAIFDECHHVAAKSYTKISTYLINTEYRLGLTATNRRDDGNDMLIIAVVGPQIFDLSSKVLIENGWLLKPRIIFYKNYMTKEQIDKFDNECKTGLINESEKYSIYYDKFITNNNLRNNFILQLINAEEKVLILVKLVEHGKLLEQLIPNSVYLFGETSTEERKEIFSKFLSGDKKVLISTISITGEGVDLPHLQTIINASANRGNVRTIQALGRVLRKLEGKCNAKYIDFIDDPWFFKRASLARKNILNKQGHDIEIIMVGD